MEEARKWEKSINRGGKFKVSLSTKVCSNHFAAGYKSDICPVPTLYMKGYEVETPKTRPSPKKRLRDDLSPIAISAPKKRRRHLYRHSGSEKDDFHISFSPPPMTDHDYEQPDNVPCSRTVPFLSCANCQASRKKSMRFFHELCEQCTVIENLRKENVELRKELNAKKRFSVHDIKDDDIMFKFYTGLQNYNVFEWLLNKLKGKAKSLHYFRGKTSFKVKRHQFNTKLSKSGKKRELPICDEMFLTLVRLRVGLTEKDLAFRFGLSQTTVSQICTTWIAFLGKELSGLICWVDKEQVQQYYPKCFKKYSNVVGIIDCTEGILEKPSIAKAQSQTYSMYKSRNTWKKLLCITPTGTVSFISKCYGGLASDRYITETCGLMNKLEYGDNLMADKGFNISDLLVAKGAKLIIPPFVREKGKFSKKNVMKTSNIAKARIHVERAIARIKDFRILQGAFPLTLKDQIDDIFNICAAITNLAPALVPL